MTFLESMKIELEDEKNRIISSFSTKNNKGIIIEYITSCKIGCAEDILKKSKEILLLINENSSLEWPSLDEWISILPRYFTNLFSDSPDDENWDLSSWLYWFELDNRAWFLWDVELIDDAQLKISILVYEHPFPSEALEVFFMRLGINELEEVSIY